MNAETKTIAKQCYCRGKCNAGLEALEHLRQGHELLAYDAAKQSVIENPSCPKAHAALGCAMMKGRSRYAIEHFGKAIEMGEATAINYANRGWAFHNFSAWQNAKSDFENALLLEPDNNRALAGLAKICELENDYERAIEILKRAPRGNGITLSNCLEMSGKLDEAIFSLLDTNSSNEILARGRLYEKAGNLGAAWKDYETGNNLARTVDGHKYQRDLCHGQCKALFEFANEFVFNTLPRSNHASRSLPIFIVGFPRSGTTLIEQVLASHSEIAGGDELVSIFDLVAKSQSFIGTHKTYPNCLYDLLAADKNVSLNLMRDYYLSRANDLGLCEQEKLGAPHPKFTDKMPLNELHIPLISLLFPQSPIIYVRRHPLDIILSNYALYLTHGWNQSFALQSSADCYAHVQVLLERYKSKLKNIRYTEVKYEDFVANPEPETKRLLAFCGVDFEPQCLAFHENERRSRTSSYNQIQKPLYSQSVNRWHKFRDNMKPAIDILRGICEKNGYPV